MSRPRGRPPYADQLTPSEWKVVEAVRHGLSNPNIARRLGVSIDAVKYHVTNAMLKLGFSTRQELRRWTGVAKASSLAEGRLEMGTGFALGALAQVSRTVADIHDAQHWYADVLGLPLLYAFGDLAFFDCGGVRLYLSKGGAGGSDSVLYFRVPDVRSAHTEMQDRGIVFINAPHMIHRHADGTEEWMAFFKDNEGRPLAIMSQHPAHD